MTQHLRALTMEHSRAALPVWEKAQERHFEKLERCTTNYRFYVWERRERALLRRLQHAFYLDTRDRNSWSSCKAVHPNFIRKMVSLTTSNGATP